jgi:2-succinyl-5-enolpyruvyl-6-hydroxy-3-cyclohexene-1-carboxylate synthase
MSILRANLDSIAQACWDIGIRQWVVSPGSRNAPLVASIIKHGKFDIIVQADERSAAFIGLGANIAKVPTAIICTSGTAAANYYSAICEAYYAQMPLLVCTADRPAELIDSGDGQCIRQKNMYAQHIKNSYHIEGNLHEMATWNELHAIMQGIKNDLNIHDLGPIHLNIPIADPIYEEVNGPFKPRSFDLATETENIDKVQSIKINPGESVIIYIGEQDADIENSLKKLQNNFPIITEKTANIYIENTQTWEQKSASLSSLPVPDVLITLGKNTVNKSFKTFIKNNRPIKHYHIHTNKYVQNPFFTDIQSIRVDDINFILQQLESHRNENNFNNTWFNHLKIDTELQNILLKSSAELRAIQGVFNAEFTAVHIGNSTAIRLAGLLANPSAKIYCNRGTSGIDGCLSTAMGYALSQPNQKVACVLGDISYLYDNNAHWVNPKPQNLQIIILNNGEGNIFNLINGPNALPELKTSINTPHYFTAKKMADHYGYSYSANQNAIGGSTEVVEIFSEGNLNLWKALGLA